MPLGKPINFPLPGAAVTFAGGNLAVAARGRDFVVAAMVYQPVTGASSAYAMGVMKEKVFGPARMNIPLQVGGIVDIAASPAGGYLLLFFAATGEPLHPTLFAQELDARGVLQGSPVALTGDDYIGVAGAVTSLRDGRWLVVTRAQQSDVETCNERLIGTVLSSGD